MALKKILRITVIVLASVIGLILLFVAVSVVPLKRKPIQEKPEYAAMMSRLDSLHPEFVRSTKGFSFGFAKENITPAHPTALAGYGNRFGKVYTAVHDSVYIRTLVVDNGSQRVAIVSADLLIIPPTVTELLEKELPEVGFTINNTYLGAVHTHNSIGNWGEKATGILFGSYEDSIVHLIVNKIKQSIARASMNMVPGTIRKGAIPVPTAVRNRLIKTGGIDSLLRVIEIHRSDSSKFLLMSYTAHATCLFSRDLELSRDYPGELVDEMEASGYSFAMFMAGAVGSQKANPPEYGKPCLVWMASELKTKYIARHHELKPVTDSTLLMIRVPLELPSPEAKIAKDWQIRPWLFNAAFGKYPTYLTALRLGDIVMIGTPCDYSGALTASLDSLAAKKKISVMVTSFNGGYIGYITADQYYDRDHYETRLMNWYGPGNGAYITKCIHKLIDALDGEHVYPGGTR
jgi:neutral ceramidase